MSSVRPAGLKSKAGRRLFGEIRARARQADFLAAQLVEIADTVREGKKVQISQKDGSTRQLARPYAKSHLGQSVREAQAHYSRRGLGTLERIFRRGPRTQGKTRPRVISPRTNVQEPLQMQPTDPMQSPGLAWRGRRNEVPLR